MAYANLFFLNYHYGKRNRTVIQQPCILEKHSKENLISQKDVLLLVHELSRMHYELYDGYKEFKEVNVTLMEKIKTHHKEFGKRVEKRGALKVLELVAQGYKPAEIKKMVLV